MKSTIPHRDLSAARRSTSPGGGVARTRRTCVGLLAMGLALLPPTVFGQPAPRPLGVESRANSYTTGNQRRPAVATDGLGRSIVTWESIGHAEGSLGIRARRFDEKGEALSDEFQVNSATTTGQAAPAVAADRSGGFVVVWSSGGDQDGDGSGVFAQRFNDQGMHLAGEFRVNTTTTGTQASPALAMNAEGSFVVVWHSYDLSLRSEIFAQRFDAMGQPLSFEFQVHAETSSREARPDVDMDALGNFVVVWSGFPSTHIRGQRFDVLGQPVGGQFQANAPTTYTVRNPRVASAPDGEFLVVWQSYSEVTYEDAVARTFDANGQPSGLQFIVDQTPSDDERYPDAAHDGARGFVVVWQSYPSGLPVGGSYIDVRARRYDANGSPLGEGFTVNSYTTGFQGRPAIGPGRAGRFTLSWESDAMDPFDVYSQSFLSPLFADGFESGSLSAWSDTSP